MGMMGVPVGMKAVPLGMLDVPAGTVAIPVGAMTIPAGTAVLPVGTVVIPAGTMVLPLGMVTIPAGTVLIPRGMTAISRFSGHQSREAEDDPSASHCGERELKGAALDTAAPLCDSVVKERHARPPWRPLWASL